MKRSAAIEEIKQAGAKPVEIGAYLKFSFDNGAPKSFFPNHYENMRRGEVVAAVLAAKPSVVERRRPNL